MTVSAMFGVRMAPTTTFYGGGATAFRDVKPRVATGCGGGAASVIECSSRPQKKATAHHMKTRPKKTQAWDIRRGPTVYAPLPPLPPEWTLVTPAPAEDVSSTPQPTTEVAAAAEQA